MKTLSLLALPALVAVGGAVAHAQSNPGFALERYEPTAAGDPTFLVDHPWYARGTFGFAAGLTVDYSHDPLVFGTRDASGNFTRTGTTIEHQLVAHLDGAVSLFDRVQIAASIPLVLYEGGTAGFGVSPSGVTFGDPRVGALVRIWGDPLRDGASIHAGLDFWIPVGTNGAHAGDESVRFLPKVVAAGFTHHILWSALVGFEYRPDASIGALPSGGAGNTVGSELKFGGAIAYADFERGFSIGPELLASTVVTGPVAGQRASSSIEALVGGRYKIAHVVDAGLAVGTGFLGEPGTPDFRLIGRVAWAPEPREEKKAAPPADSDGDGIADTDDACPQEKGVASSDPQKNGCPPPRDRDHDGVVDEKDQCPDVPAGANPDPDKPGCPLADTDKDGVFDRDDQCPDVPAGSHPRATKKGCPDTDTDGDGVFDSQDQCPQVPAGLHPDAAKPGCPLPDADQDGIPDATDACPDKPGAPNPDPKKNGCPGLVEIKNGKLNILQPVFFATGKDVILPKSFPVLQAVADALTASPEIKRVSVEGHTDDRGKPAKNLDLSDRRAKSVMRFLVEHGIDAARVEAHGYGQTRPIDSNRTDKGRAANRRVEFRIVEPAQSPTP